MDKNTKKPSDKITQEEIEKVIAEAQINPQLAQKAADISVEALRNLKD